MTKIFVGNVSYQTTDRELQSAFERYGRVANVSIPTDRSTGRPRGIAFGLQCAKYAALSRPGL